MKSKNNQPGGASQGDYQQNKRNQILFHMDFLQFQPVVFSRALVP
jgi:hypothetical protein